MLIKVLLQPRHALFFQQVERSSQLQFQLCALRQVQLMSAPGFLEVSGQGSEGCTLCGFFFIFVLHPLNRAARCTRSGRLGGVLLRATASFD